jgi:His/Glu/Gln/Arg/opine family amino acid ABC transporter permease subunit
MRWAQYLVLVIVAVVAISVADWGQIQKVFFRGDMIRETFAQGLPNAFKNTIIYTLGAFALGLIWGTVLALMRLSSVAPYRWLATIYIEFFRGLPAIVVFIAFGLLPLAFPGLVIPFDPYGTVWIALGLVGAAYMAETIRAGIQAVPKGQVEAARSLGMPSGVATRKIPADERADPARQGLLAGLHPRVVADRVRAHEVRSRHRQHQCQPDAARHRRLLLPAHHPPAVHGRPAHGSPSEEGALTWLCRRTPLARSSSLSTT